MMRQDASFQHDEKIGAGTITPQFRSPEKILQDIRRCIQVLAEKQEKLSRARDNLLTKRESTRASSKKVRLKRSEAGDAEAAFMDHIRGFMNGATTPSSQMITLFNKVEKARDELGAMETDHQELERSLTGADWIFKEEEDELYQYGLSEIFDDILASYEYVREVAIPQLEQLPPPPAPPLHLLPHSDAALLHRVSPPPQTQPPPTIQISDGTLTDPVVPTPPHAPQPSKKQASLPPVTESEKKLGDRSNAELDGLGNQFDPVFRSASAPPGTQVLPDLSDGSLLAPGSLSSFPASAALASETYSQGLSSTWLSVGETATDYHSTSPEPLHGRRRSDPTSHRVKDFSITQSLERSLSDNSIIDIHRGRAAKTRVRTWLLSQLKDNSMEKTLYQTILEATLERFGYKYPDHEPWGFPATQYWGRDSRSSFETDPLDKSTADLGTTQEIRFTDNPILVGGESIQSAPNLYQLDLESTSQESPLLAARDEDGDLDPFSTLLPPAPNICPNVTAVSARDESFPFERQKAMQRSKSTLPIITVASPNEDEATSLRQATFEPLPPSPSHLSYDPATLFQYRLDLTQSTTYSNTVQHMSKRESLCNFIFPSWRRRCHSMSSTTRPRNGLYGIKRTLSKDRI